LLTRPIELQRTHSCENLLDAVLLNTQKYRMLSYLYDKSTGQENAGGIKKQAKRVTVFTVLKVGEIAQKERFQAKNEAEEEGRTFDPQNRNLEYFHTGKVHPAILHRLADFLKAHWICAIKADSDSLFPSTK
jgi:hypothetical protein